MTGDEAPAGPVPPPGRRRWVTRRLLDAVAVLVVGVLVVSSLPDSDLRDRLRTVERPVTDVTGLSQNWALFAPVPRSTFLRLRAEVERADGSVVEWVPPVGDRILGVYRSYRWRKWAGGVVDPDASTLHRGAASYLRSRVEAAGGPPVREVRLYRGSHRQPGPGSGEPAERHPRFDEEQLFRLVVPAAEDADASTTGAAVSGRAGS